jgi:hypothetical protein
MRLVPATSVVVLIYALSVLAVALWPPTFWLGAPAIGGIDALLALPVATLTLDSGPWTISYGDVIVTCGLVALFVEVIRATAPDEKAIIERGLSLLVLLVALMAFVLVPGFNTSVFFMIVVIALIDVAAGYSVSVIAARREVAFKT